MTAKIKLNAASGGGSISIQAPSSSSNNRVISLPDIADGTLVTSQSTLDATKLSGNLPAISGAALTGISAGITEADQFQLTADTIVNATATTITSNLARSGYSFAGTNAKIGTGMSESSGVFTFPSTGKYLIMFCASFRSASPSDYVAFRPMLTVDNGSNWYYVAVNSANIRDSGSAQVYTVANSQALVDITDVSTHKFRCSATSNGAMVVRGHANEAFTSIVFAKLGDT